MKQAPIKILVVLNAFELDGPGLFVLQLLKEISRNPFFELQVIAISRNGKLRAKFNTAGIKAHYIRGRTLLGILLLSRRIKALYPKNEQPDIIHTHLLWPDLLFRLVRSSFPKSKLVSTCHGLHASGEKGFVGKVYDLIERITRSRCDGWIGVSKFVANEMVEKGYPAKKVHAIPNGVDQTRFKQFDSAITQKVREKYKIPEGVPFLVGAGNLRLIKQQHVMVRAMRLVVDEFPEARLIHFGKGAERHSLFDLTRELGLRDHIRFCFPIHLEFPKVLSSADLFVHTSKYESYSLVTAEALSCGTPVIATDTAALPELVVEGKTGALFPVGNHEVLAEKIIQFFKDESFLDRSEFCKLIDSGHISSIQKCAERYMQYWKDLVTK